MTDQQRQTIEAVRTALAKATQQTTEIGVFVGYERDVLADLRILLALVDEQEREIERLAATADVAVRNREAQLDAVARLKALVSEVAMSGIEMDDARVRYLTVQISRPLWSDLQREGL